MGNGCHRPRPGAGNPANPQVVKVTEANLTYMAIDMNGQSPLPFLHAAPSQRPVISTCTLPPSPCMRSITAV